MPESETSSRQRLAVRVCTTVVALFVLYPLSIGPAIAMVGLTERGEQAFGLVYGPAVGIAYLTGTQSALDRYLRWWTDLADRLKRR